MCSLSLVSERVVLKRAVVAIEMLMMSTSCVPFEECHLGRFYLQILSIMSLVEVVRVLQVAGCCSGQRLP